jgi:hypothetical protein
VHLKFDKSKLFSLYILHFYQLASAQAAYNNALFLRGTA